MFKLSLNLDENAVNNLIEIHQRKVCFENEDQSSLNI